MTLIIFMYALLAASFPISKTLLQYTTPIFLTGARMFIAGIVLLVYQYGWAREQFVFKRKHIPLYAQVTFFGVYVGYMLRFWGLEYLSAAKTCFMFNLSPFFSALYEYIFFRQKMTSRQWTGLLVGFVGIIPMLLATSIGEEGMSQWAYISWPELAILCSIAVHSYSWIGVRKLVSFHDYTPTMVNGLTMTVGGILALATSLVVDGVRSVSDPFAFFSLLAVIIIVSNIICHTIYGNLLKKYTSTFVAFAGFLAPIFSALYSWAFLREDITWHFYLSGGIVFIGLMLFYQDELTPQKLESASIKE